MTAILLFLTLAVTVEGLVQYIKTLAQGEKKAAGIQIGALAIAIALCIMAKADIYSEMGITFSLPYVGCVLTGIFASRGANYASDILGRLQQAGNRE